MSRERCKAVVCFDRAAAAIQSVGDILDEVQSDEAVEELADLADRFAERLTKHAIANTGDADDAD